MHYRGSNSTVVLEYGISEDDLTELIIASLIRVE
jgi:hypothetical protein